MDTLERIQRLGLHRNTTFRSLPEVPMTRCCMCIAKGDDVYKFCGVQALTKKTYSVLTRHLCGRCAIEYRKAMMPSQPPKEPKLTGKSGAAIVVELLNKYGGSSLRKLVEHAQEEGREIPAPSMSTYLSSLKKQGKVKLVKLRQVRIWMTIEQWEQMQDFKGATAA